jgi:DNA-binding transcriptional LysR family regulator
MAASCRHRLADYFYALCDTFRTARFIDVAGICTRFSSGAFYRWKFERGGSGLEIEVGGSVTLSDQGLMFDVAKTDSGIAHVFEGLAMSDITTGRLIRVLEGWCPYYTGFFICYPSPRQVPVALHAFIELIRQPS